MFTYDLSTAFGKLGNKIIRRARYAGELADNNPDSIVCELIRNDACELKNTFKKLSLNDPKIGKIIDALSIRAKQIAAELQEQTLESKGLDY